MIDLSCKKPLDPLDPDKQANENPIVWNEPCRVIRTVYKTVINSGLLREPERITIEGKTFLIGINMETRYYYDEQGRLVREVFNNPADSLYNLYRYTATHLYSYSVPVRYDGKRIPRRDTVRLDKRGLAEREFYEQFYYQYDKEGYPIKGLYWNEAYKGIMTIEEGNLISKTIAYGPSFGTRTWYMTYDTIKPNIPTIKRYLGRESMNLPIQEITNIQQSTYYPNGDVYKRSFSYEFNQKGQVRRRIIYGTELNPAWPFEYDLGGFSIMDYEYDCQ